MDAPGSMARALLELTEMNLLLELGKAFGGGRLTRQPRHDHADRKR
jgi:hypothetical protein